MKKIIYFIPILVLTVFFAGCSNSLNYEAAKSFDERVINNFDYKNYFDNNRNDPLMLYIDNTLFYIDNRDMNYRGLWRMSADETVRLDTEENDGSLKCVARFKTINNHYFLRKEIVKENRVLWFRYDSETKNFEECSEYITIAELVYDDYSAFKDKLNKDNYEKVSLDKIEYFTYNAYVTLTDSYNLKITYYHNYEITSEPEKIFKAYKLEKNPDVYYCSGEMIYYVKNEEIYTNVIGEAKSVLIGRTETGNCTGIYMFDSNIYYELDYNGGGGFYRYDVTNGKSEQIINSRVLGGSCNRIKSEQQRRESMFLATDNGTYKLSRSFDNNTTTTEKISDLKGCRLQIFGDKWIYFIDDDHYLRMSQDGKTVESIIQ